MNKRLASCRDDSDGPSTTITLLAATTALALLAGCEREKREFKVEPFVPAAVQVQAASLLVPGPAASAASAPQVDGNRQVLVVLPTDAGDNRYEANAYAVAQGKRWFRWYNCAGCHSNGGGGMGPALMDAKWFYGSTPAQVAASIQQGRPNGMPAFAGRITDEQLWQIVAYVRSMSGQLSGSVAPGRNDGLSTGWEPESRRERAAPQAAAPASR